VILLHLSSCYKMCSVAEGAMIHLSIHFPFGDQSNYIDFKFIIITIFSNGESWHSSFSKILQPLLLCGTNLNLQNM
jgi:hypothetical protein